MCDRSKESSSAFPEAILVSARTGKGIEELKSRIGEALAAKSGEPARVEASGVIPDDRPELLAQICATGQVLESRESEAGTFVRALVSPELAGRLAAGPLR